jgi:5-methylcytosine-specific restriction protein A
MMSDTLEGLSRALGVNLIDSKVPEGSGYTFALRIKELSQPVGFEIRVKQSLMSTSAKLFLDNYPADLLGVFNVSFASRKEEILSVIESISTLGFQYVLNINDKSILDIKPEAKWNSIEFEISKKISNYLDASSCLKQTVLMALSIIVPLVTLPNESNLENLEPEFETEGAKSQIYVNKYERSRINRAICLSIHGFVCAGCDLRMSDLYGPIGEGVIHVHHIEPVSLMDSPRKLNPAVDLVPLCPNCHVIVHRKTPPIPIEELKDVLTK